MTAREHLDQMDALRAAGTPRTWSDQQFYPTTIVAQTNPRSSYDTIRVARTETPADAALIVAAVNALPQHVAAIRAVLGNHVPVTEARDLTGPPTEYCTEDGFLFPCPTVAAITEALNPMNPSLPMDAA